MYGFDSNLSNVWSYKELILLDKQPNGAFQTEITETRDIKFVEDSFSIGQQVFFPFLIAGSGTVSTGILLEVVTEVNVSLPCMISL